MTHAKPDSADSAQRNGKNSAAQKSGFKRFFDGISWSQLIASGLSALTVFLLTAKIGMAGSIIGAILASMVSTFSSQLYRNMLDISGDKLRSDHSDSDDGNLDEEADIDAVQDPSEASAAGGAETDSAAARTSASSSVRAVGGAPTQRGETLRYHATGQESSPAGRTAQSTRSIAGSSSRLGASGRARSAGKQNAAGHGTRHVSTFTAQERAKRRRRSIILVAVISALLTIGITSGIVLLVTHGEGTDSAVPVLQSNQNQNSSSDTSTQRKDSSSDDQSRSQDYSTDSGVATEQNSGSSSSTTSGSTESNTTGSAGSSTSGSTGSKKENSRASTSDSTSSGSTSSSTGTPGSTRTSDTVTSK